MTPIPTRTRFARRVAAGAVTIAIVGGLTAAASAAVTTPHPTVTGAP